MQKKLFFIAVALMGMTTIFGQTPNYQGIIYVTSTGAGTHSGDSWANATSSIADAQAIAQAHNAVVWVAAGTYYGDTTATAENAFTMVEGVNVYGGFVGNEPANYDLSLRDFVTNETILDGDSSRRVLYQSSNFSDTTIWDGFTIRNGYTTGNGGGAYLYKNVILNHCNICNNDAAGHGGGAYLYRIVVLKNCSIHNNKAAGDGGGVYDAYYGSSYYCAILNCRITKNIALNDGGGMFLNYNTFVNNCIVSNNTAVRYGGGICTESACTINNTTIVRNRAIYGGGVNFNSSYPYLTNCIVWGNENNYGDSYNTRAQCSYTAIEGGGPGSGNITLMNLEPYKPLFVNPSLIAGASDTTSNVDWHLQQGSICINRGNNALVNDSLDIEGTTRIKRGTVDMGCYESNYEQLIIPEKRIIYVTPMGAGDYSGDSWANAMASIDHAQEIAQNHNAVVWVAMGTYFGDTLSNKPIAMKGVNVFGGFVGNEPEDYNLLLRDFESNATILDGQNVQRGLTQHNPSDIQFWWDGFTIQNGYTLGNGGGVFLAEGGSLNNCIIRNNFAGAGGGVLVNNYSSLSNCKIHHNTADYGGGVQGWNNYTISNCLIYNNTALGERGGGGIYLTYNNNGSVVANNTVVCNYAVRRGGLNTYLNGIGDNQAMLINNIFWANEDEDTLNDNFIFSYSHFSAIESSYVGDVGDNIILDRVNQPLFVNPSLTVGAGDSTGNVDWHLLPNSVCINQGNNSYVTDSTDLDGLPRIGCNVVDMGCYEFYRVNHVYQTVPTSYTWHGNTYIESGDYPWLGLLSTYCDSLEVLHLTVGNVGVDNPSTIQEGTMRLYPNPTTGVVNVQLTMNNEHLGNAKIQVFDIYGKLVGVVETLRATSLQTGTSAQTQIDLSRYANGVYFIKVVADGNVIGVKKVVKQ